MSEIQFLAVPERVSVRYDHNFIVSAVCELRFPVLLELEETPPIDLQKRLRKEYPNFSEQQALAVGGGAGPRPAGKRYLFETRKKDWTVSLRPDALAVETKAYTEFEAFEARLDDLLKASQDLLDTDYFTRVGLRYINRIPVDDGDLQGWLSEGLVSLATSGVLGTPSRYHSEIRGFLPEGQYTLQYGLEQLPEKVEASRNYYLDIDYYQEGVQSGDALNLMHCFSKRNFSLFSWALGEKAKHKLGRGKPKGD